MLTDLIARYLAAQGIWHTQFDVEEEKSADSAEWHAYMAASSAIIDFRCSSMAEISEKAAFILSEDLLVDMIANSSHDVGAKDFLMSMLAPVDKSNNGEKSP